MSNPSSFSSISFETETAIKFKKIAKDENKTHTKLLNELMTEYDIEVNKDRIKWAAEALTRDSKNE